MKFEKRLIFSPSTDQISQKSPALAKVEPDRTIYISFDVTEKTNPHYQHPIYYTKDDSFATIDGIALKVVRFQIYLLNTVFVKSNRFYKT